MKIVYIYNGEPLDTRNMDGTWGTSQGLSHHWKLMGHDVLEVNFSKTDCEAKVFDLLKDNPDVVLLSEAGTIPDHVKRFWKKDSFPNSLMVAEGCDEPQILMYNLFHTMPAELVWSSDLDAVRWYVSRGKIATWLPHWGDELVYSYTDDPCNGIITTSAAGPRKGIWEDSIRSLSLEFGEKFVAPRLHGGKYLTPSKNNELYEKASINFTVSTSGDITRRLFEAAVAGRMTICERLSSSKSMGSVFVEGEEIICFDSVDELIEKSKYYLTNHEERMRIASNARRKCLQFHTASARAHQLITLFQECIEAKKQA